MAAMPFLTRGVWFSPKKSYHIVHFYEQLYHTDNKWEHKFTEIDSLYLTDEMELNNIKAPLAWGDV